MARRARLEEQLAFRYYLSELIRQQAQGKTFAKGWLDFRRPTPEETADADEIIDDVVSRSGITLT